MVEHARKLGDPAAAERSSPPLPQWPCGIVFVAPLTTTVWPLKHLASDRRRQAVKAAWRSSCRAGAPTPLHYRFPICRVVIPADVAEALITQSVQRIYMRTNGT